MNMPAKLWNRWSSWHLLQEWTKEKNCWHPGIQVPGWHRALPHFTRSEEHSQEDVCYHVMTAGTEEILDRCQSGKDDIGFVYVSEEQMPSFQYRLECGKLEFQELKRTKAYLYFGKEHPLAGKQSIEEIPRDQVRLVQCYEDEYTLGRNLMGNMKKARHQI